MSLGRFSRGPGRSLGPGNLGGQRREERVKFCSKVKFEHGSLGWGEAPLGVSGKGMGNVDRDPASSLPVDVSRDGVISTFARGGGAVYRCYSSCARGTECFMGYYAIVDRAPDGRGEGDSPMSWLRRHDESPHHGHMPG